MFSSGIRVNNMMTLYAVNCRVMYFSIHKYLDGEEWPYLRESDYDYIGEGPGTGFNVNVPLNVVCRSH